MLYECSTSVSVKHYLRGEEGINYVDLYHLVKFLPTYPFPEGIARSAGEQFVGSSANLERTTSASQNGAHTAGAAASLDLPPPATSASKRATDYIYPRKRALQFTEDVEKGDYGVEDMPSVQRPAAQVPKGPVERMFTKLFSWSKKVPDDLEHRFVNPIVTTRNVPLEISLYLVRSPHSA